MAKFETRFWRFVAILMALLGFNKQLDLQTVFTQIGRYFAQMEGWSDQRQTVQFLVIIGLPCVAGIAAFILLWIFRKLATEIRIASAGLGILITFIVIRAASFRHADRFLGERLIDLRLNALLGFGSIIMIAAAGVLYRRSRS